MSSENQLGNEDNKQSGGGNLSRERYRLWILGVVICNAIVLLLLFVFAHGITDYASWANVIAISLVGLASIDVVAISALTSREIVEIMGRQEFEMTETRKAVRDQWKAMQEQLKVIQKTQEDFIVTERAYIGIRSIKLVEPLVRDKMPVIHVVFVNGGRTPAWNLIGNCMPVSDNTKPPLAILNEYITEFAAEPETLGSNKMELFGQTGLLPAGAEDDNPPLTFVGDKEEWSEGIPKIMTDRIPLYLVGWARYRDFQGKRYRYEFISYYNKSVQGFIECVSRTVDDPEPQTD